MDNDFTPPIDYDEQERQKLLAGLDTLRRDIRIQRGKVATFLTKLNDGTLSSHDAPPEGYEHLHSMALTLQQLEALATQNMAILETGKIQTDSIQTDMNSIVEAMLAIQQQVGELGVADIEVANKRLEQKTNGIHRWATLAIVLAGVAFMGVVVVFLLTNNAPIEETTSALAVQVTGVQGGISSAQEELDKLRERINDAESTLEALSAEITAIDAKPTAEITADPRIAMLEIELTTLNDTINNLTNVEAPTPDPRIEIAQTDIDALKTQLEQANATIIALRTDLDTANRELANLPVSQPPVDIAPLENRLAALEEQLVLLQNQAPAAPEATPAPPTSEATDVPTATVEATPTTVKIKFTGNPNLRPLPSINNNPLGIISPNDFDVLGYFLSSENVIWLCISAEVSQSVLQTGWVSSTVVLLSVDGGVTFAPVNDTVDTDADLSQLLPTVPAECPTTELELTPEPTPPQ